MSMRFFRTTLIFVLIPSVMACSLFTSTPAPSQTDIEKAEQEVFSFFMNDADGPVLILQTTSTSVLDEDPQGMLDNLKDGLEGISKETIKSYVERNAEPSQLSPDMQLGADYILLSQTELAEISKQSNWGEVLQERYPGSHGYLIFSRVGLNNALDQAVVYVGNVGGPLMGSGSYYLLEKQADTWKLKKEIAVWIS